MTKKGLGHDCIGLSAACLGANSAKNKIVWTAAYGGGGRYHMGHGLRRGGRRAGMSSLMVIGARVWSVTASRGIARAVITYFSTEISSHMHDQP